MSAITGICDLRAIWGRASASSCDGTATRTIWQPAAVSSAICCSVAFTSAVSVVVIDCTETGAPPPTATACDPLPTMIWRDFRRVAIWARGGWGKPRSTVMMPVHLTGGYVSLEDVYRVDEVRQDQEQGEADQDGEHAEAHRDQLSHVDQAGVRLTPKPRQPGPDPLVDNDRDMPAVQGQQRQQVEQPDEDVHRDYDQQHQGRLGLPADVGRHHLAGDLADADDAGDLPGRRAGPVLGEQVRDRRRQAADHVRRAGDRLAEHGARVGYPPQRAGALEDRRRGDAEERAWLAVDLSLRQRDGLGELGAAALDGHRDRAVGLAVPDGRVELAPVVHRLA